MAHILGHVGTGLLPTGQSVQQPLQGEFIPAQQNLPQFGLAGAEGALLTGATIGRQDLSPFAQTGVAANQQQAAFSGALGPQAQTQAFQGFQESPGQQFLEERGLRAVERSAAARGGLGGGNVLSALQEQGIGFAAQNLAQQQSQLNQLANRGFGAVQQGADIATGTGSQIGSARLQAGRDIAAATGATTSALSGLAERQGAGISDITGQGSLNLSNLIAGAGQGIASDQQQLAALLANISTGSASQVGGLDVAQQFLPPSALGQLGQVASGVGGLISSLPQQQQQPAFQQQPVFVGDISGQSIGIA